ncbi:MAG: NFACT RNA binding domain-containing protein [Treponema sp.]|nr:NFACT RNA binding domain-containing protein [Treponema sp.]
MSLNCNEINIILSELSLEGAFIQDIIQPGYDTLALFTYKNATPRTILICTAHDACRINATYKKITRNDKPLRFMEFLKSRIRGARIDACVQIGLERVIAMKLSHGNERFILYIRLWSSAANILLCTEDNVILDSMFRRPAKNEITGNIFTPPVPDDSKNGKEWPVRSFDEIQEEYRLQHPETGPLSFNQKVDIWYSEHARALSRESLLMQAEKWYNITKSRRAAALEKLRIKQAAFRNAEQYKHQGDLILSYGYLADGKSEYLECTDYDTGNIVRIHINPAKNAQENAAEYYTNYHKAQTGAEQLQHDIELAEKQIVQLDKMYADMQHEQNPVRIEQMLRHDSTPDQQKKKTHPGLDYTVNGWYILVGRDANENDDLLRHYVRGPDMWLHVRDFPGGYVFIKNRPGKTIPLDILLDAANLAIYYSKARKSGKADLYYTQVKHLRRAKNGPKGLVLPTQEKNLCVELDQSRLNLLDSIRQEEEFK